MTAKQKAIEFIQETQEWIAKYDLDYEDVVQRWYKIEELVKDIK